VIAKRQTSNGKIRYYGFISREVRKLKKRIFEERHFNINYNFSHWCSYLFNNNRDL